MLLKFSYVPDAFGEGIIVPVIKNRHGDLSSLENYRPITLSPVISKVFENFLLEVYSKFLCTDDLQFGFKKNLGCSHAIFLLKQTVGFFNNNDSNVYLESLDASKAFDRLNHFKLYTTLVKMHVPMTCINLIINWYGKLNSRVKWFDHLSDSLIINSGVRQGGILSPILFNCYVNILIVSLRKHDFCCKLFNKFLGCIMYADDLILLSSSIIDLQRMLDICNNVGLSLGLTFNHKNLTVCLLVHCIILPYLKC